MKKHRSRTLGSWSLMLCVVLMLFGTSAAAQSARRAPSGKAPQALSQGPQQAQPSYSPIKLGLGGGLNFPLEDTDDWLDLNLSLHGTVLGLVPNSPLKFEGDIGYWFLRVDDKHGKDLEGKDIDSPSLLTLTGGLRYYLAPTFHLDGGLGLYRFSDWDDMDYEKQSRLGLYGGIGFEQSMFDFTVRIHHSDFYEEEEDFWNIGASFRIFFL